MSRYRAPVAKPAKVKTTIEFKDECSFCTGPCRTKESQFNKRYRPLEKTTHTASFETKECFITFTEVEERVIRSRSDITKSETRREEESKHYRHRKHGKKRKISDIDLDMENVILMMDLEKKEELRINKKLGLVPDPVGKCERLLNEVGPHWYQELSYNQMMFASMLGPVLIMDMEEFNLCRMHKIMDGLGISPPPTNEQLLKAARLSYLNPILFLVYLFKFTSQEETFYPKNFSVNDRIILSAMAHIALPRTIVDLESRLPKGFFKKPPFVAKRTYKPLPPALSKTYYQNKKDKPTSPYLQTLPYFELRCRQNEAHFREEEKFLNKLAFKSRSTSKTVLNEIISYDNLSILSKKEKDKIEDSLLYVKAHNDPNVTKHKPPRRNSKVQGKSASETTVHFVEDGESGTSVAPPGSGPTETPKPQLADELASPKARGKVQIQSEGSQVEDEEEVSADPLDEALPPAEQKESQEPNDAEKVVAVIPGNESGELKPEELKERLEELNVQQAEDEAQQETEVVEPVVESDKVYNRIVGSYYTPIDSVLDSLDAAFKLAMEGMVLDPEFEPPPPPSPEPSEESTVESCGLVLREGAELPAPLPTRPSIIAVVYGYWSGIGMDLLNDDDVKSDVLSMKSSTSSWSRSMSKKHVAKKLLARMGKEGNILAAMPDIERLPAIVEWLKYTEVPKLTADQKDKMMMWSKGEWEVHQKYPEIVPIPWARFQTNHLDWSQKNWFVRQVNQMYDKYRRDIRRAQVNDARKYWSTMFMYDFRGPPTFKEIYYTYLQAREEDTAQKKLFFL